MKVLDLLNNYEGIIMDVDGTACNASKEKTGLKKMLLAPVYPILKAGVTMPTDIEKLMKIQAKLAGVSKKHFINGAEEFLAELQSVGFPTGFATSMQSYLIQNYSVDLSEHVDHIVTGDMVKKNKPHPDMLFAMCDMMKLNPEQVVMVGDSRDDAEAAKRAKIDFYIMRNKSFAHQLADMRKYAKGELDSFADIGVGR